MDLFIAGVIVGAITIAVVLRFIQNSKVPLPTKRANSTNYGVEAEAIGVTVDLLRAWERCRPNIKAAFDQLQSELTAAREEAERLRGRVAEMEGAVDMFIEQAEFKRQCCGSMGQLRRPYEHAQRLRQQADSLDKEE